MNTPPPRRPPAFLMIALAVAVVSLIIGVANAFGQQRLTDQRFQDQEQANRATCERSVAGRDDNRAMWIYLIKEFADSPRAPAFRAELDRRLPQLECKGSVPTPVTAPGR